MSDPYLLPNGTLRNRLGITDQADLEAQESRAATARQAILDSKSYSGQFDLAFLCKIHKFLFQDIYDWAGVPRTIGLAKRDVEGPSGRIVAFAAAHAVRRDATRLFASLPPVGDLAAATPGEFAGVIGAFLVGLNNLHPFREGNGRTQRLFVRFLGRQAGFDVFWDVVTRERMVSASVLGARGNTEPMYRLLLEIIDPDRVRALRKALDFLKTSRSVPWNDLYVATTVAGQTYHGVLVGRAPPDFMMRAERDGEEWIAVGSMEDLPEHAESGKSIGLTGRRW